MPAARYAFGMRNRMDERYDMVRTVTDGELRYIRNYTPHRPYGQHVGYVWQQKSYQDWEQAHLDGTLDAVQERSSGRPSRPRSSTTCGRIPTASTTSPAARTTGPTCSDCAARSTSTS